MSRRGGYAGASFWCFRCQEKFPGIQPHRVRCIACGWWRKVCSSCASVFTGCYDDCRTKHRAMMASDEGQREALEMARPRVIVKKKKPVEGERELF